MEKLGNVGPFLLLVSVRDGAIDLIHHLQPTLINILTKKSSTFRAILGLENKGQAMEVKYLSKETLLKGKLLKLDKLFDISESSDIFTLCTLLTPYFYV